MNGTHLMITSIMFLQFKVYLNIVDIGGIGSKINGSIFDDDDGKSAHLLRFSDGIIPLRHGTLGFL